MASLKRMKDALERGAASAKIVAPRLGTLQGDDGDELLIDFSLLTTSSVLFDAVYLPGGTRSARALGADRDAIEFVTEAFRHCKAIAATTEGVELLRLCPGVLDSKSRGNGAGNGNEAAADGLIVSREPADAMLIRRFMTAIAAHRYWNRARKNRLGGAADDDTRGRAPIPRDRTDEGRRLQP